MPAQGTKIIQPWWWFLGLMAVGVAIFFRFWHIMDNQFLFYDEGMYLGYNRSFLNLVAANPPQDLHDLFIILGLMLKIALTTAKALWFFLLNLRVFITGAQGWYFARVISAMAGIATIVVTYLFAHRYFQSKKIAVLSAVFLSLLPSHVFYSRLGMQESLSTLLFLTALYLYWFDGSISWRTIVSALLLSGVFLTNYRMIIAPIFIVAIETFEAFKNYGSIHWKKLIVYIAVFCTTTFWIGSLYGGVNRYVTINWMFHQAQQAKIGWSLLNLFSYPYEVFALESLLFGLIFWANMYLIIQRQWLRLLPFVLVLLQMGMFSLAAEQGARYLCVVLPLMAIAAAVSADYFLGLSRKWFYALVVTIVLSCGMMGIQSLNIVFSRTDYAEAVHLILRHDPKAKMLSTQPLVEQLYVENENLIKDCPHHLQDLINLYSQDYDYLILDPQAYISWTKDTDHFSPPLIDFLEFIHAQVPPVAVLEHLNGVLLKRFVWDHNRNFVQSIKFLNLAPQAGYGQIRIYDIGQSLMMLKKYKILR
ncbi:MAG: hypothetical protein HY209_07085 [Candidatus Omnitrophica bacterium]|nr:hypothetical protein [Candidatus Omnitrophota bacterium]